MFITKNLILVTILTLAVQSLTFAIKIECNYEDQDYFWTALESKEYTCNGSIRLDGDDEHVKGMTHNHKPRMGNAHVHGLMIVHERNLKKFPKGIEQHFKNLKGIDFEGCGISKISSEDLRPFSELLQISLDENRLTELPHDLFRHNLKLQRIDIEGNLLWHVGLDIFNHLPHLTVVYMKNNPCTSENSYALRKEELKELAWELSVECPPTLAMLSSSLISSKTFSDNVRRISSENAEEVQTELLMEIQELEKKIHEIKRRL